MRRFGVPYVAQTTNGQLLNLLEMLILNGVVGTQLKAMPATHGGLENSVIDTVRDYS